MRTSSIVLLAILAGCGGTGDDVRRQSRAIDIISGQAEALSISPNPREVTDRLAFSFNGGALGDKVSCKEWVVGVDPDHGHIRYLMNFREIEVASNTEWREPLSANEIEQLVRSKFPVLENLILVSAIPQRDGALSEERLIHLTFRAGELNYEATGGNWFLVGASRQSGMILTIQGDTGWTYTGAPRISKDQAITKAEEALRRRGYEQAGYEFKKAVLRYPSLQPSLGSDQRTHYLRERKECPLSWFIGLTNGEFVLVDAETGVINGGSIRSENSLFR